MQEERNTYERPRDTASSLAGFCSYAPPDEFFRQALESHLSPLERQGIITTWSQRDIMAGADWTYAATTHLVTADIILLLISSDFIASDYCYSVEMLQALALHDQKKAYVVPILLRPVNWEETSLAKLKCLPHNEQPVTLWPNQDEAFVDIIQGIREIINLIHASRSKKQEVGNQEIMVDDVERTEIFQALRTSVREKFIITDADKESEVPEIVQPVALPRASTLIGRDADKRLLITQLKFGKDSGIYTLHGMAGVGKTALAAEVVESLSQDREAFPGGAGWISCEGLVGEEGLGEIWKRAAYTLRLEHIVTEIDLLARRALLFSEIKQFPRVLLALDNIEPLLDIEPLLETLAIPNHSTLLLTTRQIIAPDKLTLIRLAPLVTTDAIQLFKKRLQQADGNRLAEDRQEHLTIIASALGGLPLALELVAAYTGVQCLSLPQIIAELEEDKIEATALNFEPKRALLCRFDRSWLALSKDEQWLFAALSLLRGGTFPRAAAFSLALAVNNEKKERLRKPQAQQLIAKLVSYALLDPLSHQYYRLHPLLRDYAEKRFRELPIQVRQHFKMTAFNFWQAYGLPYPNYREYSGREAAHLWDAHEQAVKESFTAFGLKQKTSRNLSTPQAHATYLRELGLYIGTQGEQEQGRKHLQESLKMHRAMRDTLGAGLCYYALATLDEALGDYRSAYQNAYEAWRMLASVQAPETSAVVAMLGHLQQKIRG